MPERSEGGHRRAALVVPQKVPVPRQFYKNAEKGLCVFPKMRLPQIFTFSIAVCLLGLASRPVQAAGLVELDVFTENGVAPLNQQEWLQRLAEVGVSNVRIHGPAGLEKVGVETRGTEARPVYAVTGMLSSNGELVLPGGKYRSSQAAAVARWLRQVAEQGPTVGGHAKKLPFGLSSETFEQVRGDMAQKVDFSTQGEARADVAAKLARQLTPPLSVNRSAVEAMEDDKVAEELKGLSLGTALAYALRPAGLCLVPVAAPGDGVRWNIRSSKQTDEPWPIGWTPEKPLPRVLPSLYESFNANVQNVSVRRVLDALSKRMKVPILLDYNALARHGVDPEKTLVNAPQSRTSHSRLLSKILSQAKLKYEVRVDEAAQPFIWVTTTRPLE